MGKHRLPTKNIFAIIKCHISCSFFPDLGGVEYTKVYAQRGRYKGKPRWYIIEAELTKEEAIELIDKHKMTQVFSSHLGTLWETTPTFRSQCEELGLTYPESLRKH